MTAAAIFAVSAALSQLAPCWADRDLPAIDKQDQLDTVAVSIVYARSKVKWRGDTLDFYAMMATIGDRESRYCTDIHAGNCPPGRCGGGAAFGVFQVEPKRPDDGWALVGLDQDSTNRSALAAATVLSRSWHCGPGPRGWFTAYAGRPCGKPWPTLDERVRVFWRMRELIRKGMARPEWRPIR